MELPKDRLKQARENAGYKTATEAAEKVRRINKNTLLSNENGNRPISRKMAEVYASEFNVSAGWLLYGEGNPTQEKATILQIDHEILYDVIMRLRQEFVKQNTKKMDATERSIAIALAYEEKYRKLNDLPQLRPEEIATLFRKTEDEEELPSLNDEFI